MEDARNVLTGSNQGMSFGDRECIAEGDRHCVLSNDQRLVDGAEWTRLGHDDFRSKTVNLKCGTLVSLRY